MATQPIQASNQGRINIPSGPFLDTRGNIYPAWQLWLLNPNVQTLNVAAPITTYNGGLGVNLTPATGQLPVATSTGVYTPSDFTALPIFTSTTPGLAPASGGGTTKFLRADAVYASPVAGSAGQIQFNSSGVFAAGGTLVTDGAGNVTCASMTGNTASTNISAALFGIMQLRTGAGTTAIAITNSGATTQIGLYGTTPIKQAAAYTMTYSTAARTVPAATFTDLSTTAAVAFAWGFATQGQADAIATKVNALGVDVDLIKRIIVSLINDLGKSAGIGINGT